MAEEVNEDTRRFEQVTLHSAGPIPGIPGDHAPGDYVIDWQERTITPLVVVQSSESPVSVDEAVAQLKQVLEEPEEATPPPATDKSSKKA